MNCQRLDRKAVSYAICGALAASLVSGCAGSGHIAANKPSREAPDGYAVKGVSSKQVAKAESAVEKTPRDAAARAELANLYLLDGRFESAATTFQDARTLGDTSGNVALRLALAQIGEGKNADAIATLDGARETMPAKDYGLALALAGDPVRGVEVLAGALRAGENTPQLRQNLAYAYALSGHWLEARLMAAQDVPADQLDARISEWARQGRPDAFRLRVAAMLGAPMVEDAGQPAYLALAPAPAVVPDAQAPAMAVKTGPDGQLPPVEKGESFWLADAARPDADTPAVHPAADTKVQPAAAVKPASAATAQSSLFASAAPASPGFESKPVVQPIPDRFASNDTAPSRAERAAPARKSRAVAPRHGLVPEMNASSGGSHLVQLGSFSSKDNAERAWKIYMSRNPRLHAFDKTITQAMVDGKTYWRVAAGGFNKRGASEMCSAVKSRGHGCIAYDESHPLPGAVAARD